MTIKEQLRSNYPTSINRQGEIFSALVANDKGTAVIESLLTELQAFCTEWSNTPDVYKQTGEMLEKTVKFFSYIETYFGEPEKSLKNRVKSVFVRKHDSIWGTPLDVIHVFRQYFPSSQIYLAENTNENTDANNLIKNGEFNNSESTAWTYTDCEPVPEARFSKSYGIALSSNKAIKQTIAVKKGTYVLHWFMYGSCNVSIKDNNNRYWNDKEKIWTSSNFRNVEKAVNKQNSAEWKAESLFFIADESVNEVTIEFSGDAENSCYIDYIRLFEKKPYGSFTVIVQVTGSAANNAMALSKDGEDTEEPLPPYVQNSSYYAPETYTKPSDRFGYITGAASGFAMDIYNDLLKYLKASGIQAYIEIVNKDYIEGE